MRMMYENNSNIRWLSYHCPYRTYPLMTNNNYNELIDHLVSTMKPNPPIQDVTNSKKDWDDFWYNSNEDYPDWTNNEEPPMTEQSNNKEELKSILKEIETQSKKPLDEQLNDVKIAGARFIQSLDKLIRKIDKLVD